MKKRLIIIGVKLFITFNFIVSVGIIQLSKAIVLNYVSFMPLTNFEFAQFKPLLKIG